MSTTKQPLKYLWTAYFKDNAAISQPADDRYSKHIEGAEHNPSAFRDVLDYAEKILLVGFMLSDGERFYYVDLVRAEFVIGFHNDMKFNIGDSKFHLEDTPLTDRKVIFFRQVRQDYIDGAAQEPYVARYCFGYEGKNAQGNVEKKVIYING